MSFLPLNIVDQIIMGAASLKTERWKAVHHSLRYPAIRKVRFHLVHRTCWLTDTSCDGNPHAFKDSVDFANAERLPPLERVAPVALFL